MVTSALRSTIVTFATGWGRAFSSTTRSSTVQESALISTSKSRDVRGRICATAIGTALCVVLGWSSDAARAEEEAAPEIGVIPTAWPRDARIGFRDPQRPTLVQIVEPG